MHMALFDDLNGKKYEKIVRYVRGKVLHIGSEGSFLAGYLPGEVTNLDMTGNPDIKHDLNQYPFPVTDSQYNTIIVTDVISRLGKPYDFLVECKRMLTTFGNIIMMARNKTGLDRVPSENPTWEPSGKNTLGWSEDEIRTLAERAGLNVIDSGALFGVRNGSSVFGMLAAFMPRPRDTVYVVCGKPNRNVTQSRKEVGR